MKRMNVCPAIISLLIIVLMLTGQQSERVQAASPSPTPTPTPLVDNNESGLADIGIQILPNPIVNNNPFEAQIDINFISSDTCYGIPGNPIDLYIIVDNSGSAGNGSPGSNLYHTREILQDFITQADQDIYVNPDYFNLIKYRSRIGLISTNVTTSGTQVEHFALSENLQNVRNAVNDIGIGGDTQLRDGIQKAAEQLNLASRPEAVPVILLVLHDNLPINADTKKAVEEVVKQGFSVYLLNNTFNIQADNMIVTAEAQSMVTADHYFSGTRSSDLREIFVRMSGGDTSDLAKSIYVAHHWGLPLISLISSSPSAALESDGVSWMLNQPNAGAEKVNLTYKAQITQFQDEDDLSTWLDVVYLDCNGNKRNLTQNSDFSITRVEPTLASTAIPGNELPTDQPDDITITSTVTQIPTITRTPIPGTIVDQDHKNLIGIITDFINRLLPGDTPAFLKWLLIILLVLLLLALLGLLIWWLLKRRKKTNHGISKEEIAYEPAPPIRGDMIPQWIKDLTPERSVHLGTPCTEKPDFQDTILIGLGPAGREVLAQVVESLHTRFGEVIPENVRLLQIDVDPKGNSLSLHIPAGLNHQQWVVLRPDLKEIEELLSDENNSQRWAHLDWYKKSAPGYERTRGRIALFYDLKDGMDSSNIWQMLQKNANGLDKPVVRIIGTTFDDISSGMLVDMIRLTQMILGESVGVQLWLAGPLSQDWSQRLSSTHHLVKPSEQKTRSLATLRELERFECNLPTRFYYVPETSLHDQLRRDYPAAVVQGLFIFQPKANSEPTDDVFACMADSLLALLHQKANFEMTAHLKSKGATAFSRVNTDGFGVSSAIGSYSVRIPGKTLSRAIAWRMVRDVLFENVIGLISLEKVDPYTGKYSELNPHESETHIDYKLMRDEIDTLIHRFSIRSPVFQSAILKHLNDLLNGEEAGGESVIKRRNMLTYTREWLKMLVTRLNQSGEARQSKQFQDLIQQIEQWQETLSGLKSLCASNFEDARQNLEKLRNQKARYWALDDKLEWKIYQEIIRPWDEDIPQESLQQDFLLRLARRFGWHVTTNGLTLELRLFIPPGDYVYESPSQVEYLEKDNAFSKNRVFSQDQILGEIYKLAEAFSSQRGNWVARTLAMGISPQEWFEKATPRLDANETLASEIMGGISKLDLLVVEQSSQSLQFKEYLMSAATLKTKMALVETDDPTTVTLLRSIDWLPFKATSLYDAKAWEGETVSADMYVWYPEQIAAEIEGEHHLSTRFVSWLARDRQLMDMIGLGLIYGVVRPLRSGYEVPGWRSIIPASSAYQLLEKLFDQDRPQELNQKESREEILNELSKKVTGQRTAKKDQLYLFMQQVEVSIISSLETNSNEDDRDLAKYLRALIERELNN